MLQTLIFRVPKSSFKNISRSSLNFIPKRNLKTSKPCKYASAIISSTSSFTASGIAGQKGVNHLYRGKATLNRFFSFGENDGPEPMYDKVNSGYKIFHSKNKFKFFYGGEIPELLLAYETWGELNDKKDNTILLFTGLSPSSHAKSHQENSNPGWWEAFIGPGCALNTDKFYVVCVNVIGGCYGSSGPSSINPLTGKVRKKVIYTMLGLYSTPACSQHFGATFPCVSVQDIVTSQFLLLDHLEIKEVHGCVGSSLGGMSSLLAAAIYPERVKRLVSISSCAQSHPSSIAQRYVQRQVLMSDSSWNEGFYYEGAFPSTGMKNARSMATISYRSGQEWENRFGRKKMEKDKSKSCFGADFVIEGYLDYQGEKFCLKYDPNSMLYISKAMDLFDLQEGHNSLVEGIARIKCPALIMGVQSDMLFPVQQQRELEELLKESGNNFVTYYELPSIYGHDTFLLDVNAVAAAIKGHLETDLKFVTKKKL